MYQEYEIKIIIIDCLYDSSRELVGQIGVEKLSFHFSIWQTRLIIILPFKFHSLNVQKC